MKRFFLFVGCLIVLSACTQDPTENGSGDKKQQGAVVCGTPELAAKGTIAVKLTPEAAKATLEAQRTRGMATRSGIADLDAVFNDVGVQRVERLFAYDPQWEARYDETGINCWYALYFDEDKDLTSVGKQLAEKAQVAVVEYPIAAKYRRPASKGPARPLSQEDLSHVASTRAQARTNDPYLSLQWHYDNSGPGTGAASNRKAGADINLLDAWNLCTGKEDIIVAVIDEPIYTEHPDLQANIWSNPSNPSEHGYNFWNQSATLDWTSSEYDSDYREWMYADHGSHVAGVIAAVNNNGKGVCGIAGGGSKGNGVKLMSCQIMGYSYTNADDYADVRAFEYALKNGAVIAQNSWGYDSSMTESQWNKSTFQASRDAMNTFIKNAGKDNPNSPIEGGLVLFAAGNDGDIVKDAKTFPSAYAPLISVASMDWSYLPAYYTDYGTWVDITAPGGDAYNEKEGEVLSTILCDPTIQYKDGRKTTDSMFGYGWMQGTSMACPHVSGVAALGLAYASQLGRKFTAEQYKALLLSSVQGIDQYFTGTKYTDRTLTMSNYKNKMGAGCVDALKLLLAIKGTPAIYVKTGVAHTIDFSPYFGGANSKVTLTSASSSDLSKLGIASLPAFSGMTLTVTSANVGAGFITVKAKIGDTEISREFAIVSRPGLAENGGWL